jgi:hypothetical protein
MQHTFFTLTGWHFCRSLLLSVSAYSCIAYNLLQSHTVLSTPLINWLIHHMHGLPLGLVPLIFISDNFLVYYAHPFFNMSTQSQSSFLSLILYFLHRKQFPNVCVSPLFIRRGFYHYGISLRNFISTAYNLLFSLSVHVHVPAAYCSILSPSSQMPW